MDISEPQIPQDTNTIIEESSLDQNCGQHSYKTEMYCKDCRLLVCAICFLFGDHKGHDSADIPETRDIVTRLLSEQRHQAAAGRIKAQVAAKVEIIGEKFKSLAEKVQDFLEALKELEINCAKNLEEDIHQRLKVAQPDFTGILRYIESVGISDGRVIISEEEGTVTMQTARCRQQYCGKTESEFRTRMYQHRVSVTGTDGKTMPDLNKAIGAHYNGPGHKVSDMSVTILEKVYSKDPMVLAVREQHWINLFNTKYRGVNRNKS